MERFQIRQLQRMPSSMTVGLDGLVSDFAGTPSAGVTARTQEVNNTRSTIYTRVLLLATSAPDIGLKTGSFRHFGDTPSFIGGGHPPLESGTSNAQLMEQFNLSHDDLGHPYNDPKLNDPVLSSLQRRFGVWKRRGLSGTICRHPGGYSRVRSVVPSGDRFSHFTRTYTCDYLVGFILGFDVLVSLRTGYVTETGTVVFSSWQILWHYLKTRTIMDVLLAASLLVHVNTDEFGSRWVQFVLAGLSVERLVHITRFVRMIWLIRANQTGRGSNFWAWLLYSRYSISFVSLVSWLWSSVSRTTSHFLCGVAIDAGRGGSSRDCGSESIRFPLCGAWIHRSSRSLWSRRYPSIQLNANATSYQRKMEEVFAMTAKLQLPVPLRERIHEYYEHLWHEYECLDGEIVQFSKSLRTHLVSRSSV
ncbi:hypothetical protein GQ600_22719 [Phytophthora cactorum]|nr:hypothetical protein GQ600_22719 [Phytophthora cactorum]